MKEKIHFTAKYLLTPSHPVTVNLIGVGGTGSRVLTNLGRLHYTLRMLDHPGLFVTVYDPDIVSEANPGRQNFSEVDIGLSKADVLVSRINRHFGTAWEVVKVFYTNQDVANITISCVDNVKSRLSISETLEHAYYHYAAYATPYYWLDFGNTRDSGQVILGTIRSILQPTSKKFEPVQSLPSITEMYDLTKVKEKNQGPSCSLVAAIQEQDLFINSCLAEHGCDLLWKLFKDMKISYHGIFLNLSIPSMNPLIIQ